MLLPSITLAASSAAARFKLLPAKLDTVKHLSLLLLLLLTRTFPAGLLSTGVPGAAWLTPDSLLQLAVIELLLLLLVGAGRGFWVSDRLTAGLAAMAAVAAAVAAAAARSVRVASGSCARMGHSQS